MENKMSAKVLEHLFSALNDHSHRSTSTKNVTSRLAKAILAKGWAYFSELEDLLLETDRRAYGIDIEALAAYFDLPSRAVFQKPRFLTSSTMGFRALSAMDAASLLIRLEEIGFNTDPMALIEGLLPDLDIALYITDSEWSVLAYERLRYRQQVVIYSDANINGGERRQQKLMDLTGRRLEFTRVGDQAYRLKVRGQKYRTPPRRTFVTCDYCGHEYTKGDLESAISHRTAHARVRRSLDPRPLRTFAERIITIPDPELVSSASPMWMHREVYERAYRFKREMQFDFVQWDGTLTTKSICPESHGYLFSDHTTTHEPGTIVGACAFWRDDEQWRLRWVWVCPKMRRAGMLTHRWHQFLERYGDFALEMPLSNAMRAFVAKHGSLGQKNSLQDGELRPESAA